MKGFTFSRVTGDDQHTAVKALMTSIFNKGDCARKPLSDSHWWLVVTDHSKPAAFAGLSQFSHDKPDVAYLSLSGVLPKYCGLGLQRALIRKRDQYARAQGFRFVVTETYNNTVSANNLIRCGYRMFTPKRLWSAKGACYWFKKL